MNTRSRRLAVLALAVAAGLYLYVPDRAGRGMEPAPEMAVTADGCPLLTLEANTGGSPLLLPATDLDPLLGSTVTTGQELTVTYTGNLGRYGQLTLSAGGRMFHPNNGTCPSEFDSGPRFIVVDDDDRRQNPDPVPFLAGGATLRSGSTVTAAAGRLERDTVYMRNSGFDEWFVLLPEEMTLSVGERPLKAPDPGGTLRVGSFNMENYFTTLGERGARTAAERERQHVKALAALAGLEAQLIGLAEVENDDGVTLERLISGPDGLSGTTGTPWGYVQGEGFGRGTDAISVAFIYRTDVLEPVGPVLADTHGIHHRPPLVQRFREKASGEEFTAVMTHFKARSGCEAADPDTGSGCWNRRRDSQARQLLTFLEETLRAEHAGRVLLLGDLNAYALEEPVARLRDAGFTDLLAEFVPAQERYTYVFEPGVAGYIDHALATADLLPLVCGAAVWHINADEPDLFGFDSARFGPDLFTPDEFRSSDHDPVLVGLDLAGGC